MNTLLSPLRALVIGLLLGSPASATGFYMNQQGYDEIHSDPNTTPTPPTTAATLLAYWIGDSQSPGAVSSWIDSSNNGRNLTQGTTAKRPVATAGLMNGKTGIVFDGTDDVLELSGFYPFDSSYIVFTVIRSTVVDGTFRSVIAHGTADGSVRDFQLVQNGGFGAPLNSLTAIHDAAFTTYSSSGAAISANVGYYHSVGRTNSSRVYFQNGSTGTGAGSSFNNDNASPIYVGAHVNGTSLFFAGEIYAILIYNAMMSTADRQSVEAWLAGLYGL